jgi:hypothetical protein
MYKLTHPSILCIGVRKEQVPAAFVEFGVNY